MKDAWESVLTIMNSIRQSGDPGFERQVLKFMGHCAPTDVKASEFIARYNTFQADRLSSKGLNYAFTGPSEDAQAFLVMNESVIITDGLFLLSETTFGPFAEEVYESTINYLTGTIFPALGLEILPGAQK